MMDLVHLAFFAWLVTENIGIKRKLQNIEEITS
jgi:hypothetical protein